ncbi:Peptidase C1 and/or Inhibitor I29 domain containing protein, partial [Asbolus verrucosus]
RIFQDKLAEIERHNAKYAKGEVTYTRGINQFTDWSKKEISAFLNQNKMLKSKIPGKYGKFFVPSNAAPATEVDWRDKDVVTEVKWQGDGCQSCWSFAA